MTEKEHVGSSETEKVHKRGHRAGFGLAIGILLLIAIISLLAGPCDPAPEPVPAGECKPGQPCPVSNETTGAPLPESATTGELETTG